MYTLALSHAWLQLQHCMQLIHLYLKWVVQCPSDSGYLQFLWTNGNVRVSSGDSLCAACKKLVFFSFSSTITAKDRNPKMSDPNNVSLTGSIEQLPQGRERKFLQLSGSKNPSLALMVSLTSLHTNHMIYCIHLHPSATCYLKQVESYKEEWRKC